jgi:hypothetical protein
MSDDPFASFVKSADKTTKTKSTTANPDPFAAFNGGISKTPTSKDSFDAFSSISTPSKIPRLPKSSDPFAAFKSPAADPFINMKNLTQPVAMADPFAGMQPVVSNRSAPVQPVAMADPFAGMQPVVSNRSAPVQPVAKADPFAGMQAAVSDRFAPVQPIAVADPFAGMQAAVSDRFAPVQPVAVADPFAGMQAAVSDRSAPVQPVAVADPFAGMQAAVSDRFAPVQPVAVADPFAGMQAAVSDRFAPVQPVAVADPFAGMQAAVSDRFAPVQPVAVADPLAGMQAAVSDRFAPVQPVAVADPFAGMQAAVSDRFAPVQPVAVADPFAGMQAAVSDRFAPDIKFDDELDSSVFPLTAAPVDLFSDVTPFALSASPSRSTSFAEDPSTPDETILPERTQSLSTPTQSPGILNSAGFISADNFTTEYSPPIAVQREMLQIVAPPKLAKPALPIKTQKPASTPSVILASNFKFALKSESKYTANDPESSDGLASKTTSERIVYGTEVAGKASAKRRSEMTCVEYRGPKSAVAGKITGPFWTHHAFFDVFIGEKRSKFLAKDYDGDMHPIRRLRNSFHFLHQSLITQLNLFNSKHVPNAAAFVLSLTSALYEATFLFERFPFTGDAQSIYSFLDHFMPRLRSLRAQEFIIFPSSWTADNKVYSTAVIVAKVSEGTDADFKVTIVNTQDKSGGIDFHAPSIDTQSGAVLRSSCLELPTVRNDKLLNSTFW